MTQQVILVDDDPVQRRLLEAQVSRMGYRTVSCDGGRAALDALRIALPERRPAAMVLDLAMPGIGGMEVMAEMRRAGFDVPVVVQTSKGSIETAVEAMRAGAFDFVVKPAAPDKLRAIIERAVRSRRGGRGDAAGNGGEPPAPVRLAEVGLAMRPVLQKALRAAASTIPILIEGETGAGKEWLAEAIRLAGPRAGKPFVAVNCGALPASLAESILFGHAKGAFTDAGERRAGKFASADGGTLFLDEIGELPIEVQAKLLRAIQKGEVDPVGAEGDPVKIDVRIVSATNRDLAAEVAAGRFREDLFYRLNVLTLGVPPLRQRRDEIEPLARRFLLERNRSERPDRALRFAADVPAALERFDWPGNIRQLENAVHRAVVLADGDELRLADFPQLGSAFDGDPDAEPTHQRDFPVEKSYECEPSDPRFSPTRPAAAIDLLDTTGEIRRVEDVEADVIRFALLRYGGRLSEVARRLGIGRSTLYRKIRAYDLPAVPGESGDG